MLKGYRTHLLVLAGLLSIASLFLSGDLTLLQALQRAFEVASISALRSGIDGKSSTSTLRIGIAGK